MDFMLMYIHWMMLLVTRYAFYLCMHKFSRKKISQISDCSTSLFISLLHHVEIVYQEGCGWESRSSVFLFWSLNWCSYNPKGVIFSLIDAFLLVNKAVFYFYAYIRFWLTFVGSTRSRCQSLCIRSCHDFTCCRSPTFSCNLCSNFS